MTTHNMPLFPLNTVLFPGVPIFLHIFEERYKQMIDRCIEDQEPFGVVLIEDGVEAGGAAQPHEVGCSAEIVKVERMPDGRMNIVAIGQERFRILSTNQEQLYLQGDVEPYPLENSAEPSTERIGERLRERIKTYIDILSELGAAQIRINDGLPEDPVELGYLGAYILQVSAEIKQEILLKDDALTLLRYLERSYDTELSLLRSFNPDSGTIFSLN